MEKNEKKEKNDEEEWNDSRSNDSIRYTKLEKVTRLHLRTYHGAQSLLRLKWEIMIERVSE